MNVLSFKHRHPHFPLKSRQMLMAHELVYVRVNQRWYSASSGQFAQTGSVELRPAPSLAPAPKRPM